LHKITEGSEVTEIPSIVNNPFKRNEQFVRKGIRPQSSPAEIQWEKQKVVKSKAEEHKKPEKEKSGKSKLSFPGLKKSKKKGEQQEPTDFANPSYQQQLELSKFMHSLDAKNKDHAVNERVVVGSETDPKFEEERASTLSGLQIVGAAPLQKFSGEIELDSGSSSAISGKSPKKKKLVFKVRQKFKGGKKTKDTVDGSLPHVTKDDGGSEEVRGSEASKTNLYTQFKNDNKKLHKVPSSSEYENIDNLCDNMNKSPTTSTDNGQTVYDNDRLCRVVDSDENELNNEDKIDKSDHASRLDEGHYKQPVKVISEIAPINNDSTGVVKDVRMGEADSEYQSMRSRLRKVEDKEALEKDIMREKRVDTSIGESYVLTRSKLRRSDRDLARPTSELTSPERPLSPEEQFTSIRKSLSPTGRLEAEIENESAPEPDQPNDEEFAKGSAREDMEVDKDESEDSFGDCTGSTEQGESLEEESKSTLPHGIDSTSVLENDSHGEHGEDDTEMDVDSDFESESDVHRHSTDGSQIDASESAGTVKEMHKLGNGEHVCLNSEEAVNDVESIEPLSDNQIENNNTSSEMEDDLKDEESDSQTPSHAETGASITTTLNEEIKDSVMESDFLPVMEKKELGDKVTDVDPELDTFEKEEALNEGKVDLLTNSKRM